MNKFEYLKNGYSCVILSGEEIIFSSKESGIKPLLQIIHDKTDAFGCQAVDKIVGRAASLLYAYMGVSCVYAEIMSEGARDILSSNGISFEFKTLAKNIINRKGDGICPMESAVIGISEPEKALFAIENKITELRQNAKEN